jgi:hypothetical protein
MRASTALIALGVLAIVAGILLRFGLLSWFGNLPGDLRFGGPRSRVFIPITSMLLVSAVLTLLLNVLGRWLGSD